MAQEFTPNQFELVGRGVRVTYIPGGEGPISSAGPIKLIYHDAQHGELTFRGEEVSVLDSEIGQLVTVPLKRTVDTGGVLFTIILPTGFTINGPEDKVGFHTEGIVTTFGGPIEVPRVVGPNLTYQFVALRGTAESVVLPLAEEGTQR